MTDKRGNSSSSNNNSNEGWQVSNKKMRSSASSSNTTQDLYTSSKFKNYAFYSNQIPSVPKGDYIDNIHKHWFGKYDLLESHHGYIQWLFPVFESAGMNSSSFALGKEEAKKIREDYELAKRVIKSYRLMLNFYGLRLVDEMTGEVERESDIWMSRYRNLNNNLHNCLRINRILTSLGELGFNRYKKPLIEHFKKEILQNGHLKNCRNSLLNFWVKCLDVDSKEYIQKTREAPEDRTESVFFAIEQQKRESNNNDNNNNNNNNNNNDDCDNDNNTSSDDAAGTETNNKQQR